MRKIVGLLLITLFTHSYAIGQHDENQKDNYTIKRLIVSNDKNELIVVKYGGKWHVPALRYNQSESYQDALYNLAKAMGIEITQPKIAGIFSFTYGYLNQAALRMFYVTNYQSGSLQTKAGWDDIKWVSKSEFLKLKDQNVYDYMASKIIEDGSAVWGGAFHLYKESEEVKYNITEPFYKL